MPDQTDQSVVDFYSQLFSVTFAFIFGAVDFL